LNARALGGVSGALEATLLAGGRSNPTFTVSDGDRSWILRRPPYGHVLPSAHDMGREYHVLSALNETPVPAPAVVGLCLDEDVIGAPFYVMEKLVGRTLRTQADTEGLTIEQRRALADSILDVLVAIHDVEPDTVGLGDWGRPVGYLERQLGRWSKQWEASRTRSAPAVDEILGRLRLALPETQLPGIVHGDYKIDNLMLAPDDPTRIIGVLDWEMSTLGETLTDVGILCSFWDQPGEPFNPITAGATALPGFGDRSAVVQGYAAEGRRGRWPRLVHDLRRRQVGRHPRGHPRQALPRTDRRSWVRGYRGDGRASDRAGAFDRSSVAGSSPTREECLMSIDSPSPWPMPTAEVRDHTPTALEGRHR
jgi:aminoglycoside phosphotransferase (APT) family kinase protein